MGNTNGKMVECMSVNIFMIRSMALELIHGRMAEDTWDNGSIASVTGEGRLYQLTDQKEREYGSRIEG